MKAPSFIGCLLGATASACFIEAQVFDLGFTTLPSAQGWTYSGGSNIPESQAVSVSGGVLTHNTLADSSDSLSVYTRPFTLSSSTPFTFEVTARMTASQLPNSFYVFSILTGAERLDFSVRSGLAGLVGSGGISGFGHTLNTSVFHDYRVEHTPTVGSSLFVDNVLVGSIGSIATTLSGVSFGDSFPVPSGDLTFEISHLSLTAIPEPEHYGIITGLALLGLVIYRRRS